MKCGLKDHSGKPTPNADRASANVTSTPLSNDQLCAYNTGVLAVGNSTSGPDVLDLFLYNHASFISPIVDCDITVDLSDMVTKGLFFDGAGMPFSLASAVQMPSLSQRQFTSPQLDYMRTDNRYIHSSKHSPWLCSSGLLSPTALATATARRVDETHSNPLATWIAMGAPDYTTQAQNDALLNASLLVTENLKDIVNQGTLNSTSFSLKVGLFAFVRSKRYLCLRQSCGLESTRVLVRASPLLLVRDREIEIDCCFWFLEGASSRTRSSACSAAGLSGASRFSLFFCQDIDMEIVK